MTATHIPSLTDQPVFVGRTTEMLHLRTALADACAGQGGVVLLAGEPGIGKTRLAEELGLQATQVHTQVLWGRCYEGGSAPAFWPWVQILRTYLRTHDLTTLLADLPSDAANLVRLVPELGARLPQLASSSPLPDDDQARFYLFNSVTTLLLRAAHSQPFVLILDDLQWADTPSLLLLQFLANELRQTPLLVIATYRDGEVGRHHPLLKTLAELSRLRGVRLITMGGLGATEVAHFMQATTGQTPVATLLTTILNETGGNPFFMNEVAHHLLQKGEMTAPDGRTTLPPTLRTAIRQRLNRLSSSCNQLLNRAAVIGREFSLTRLARLGDLAQDHLLTGLDEAIQSQLIQPLAASGGAAGRYRFMHDLVRETLYAELPTVERLRLHQQVGEMLEQLHAADPDVHLAELSYHFRQAAALGVLHKAIDYTVRNAERSLWSLAYEEASRTYEQALDLLAMQESVPPAQRADLLLALGQAQSRSGETERAKQTFAQASTMARLLPDARRLALAALGFAGDVVRPGVADEQVIARLDEALAAVDAAESVLRVRLLARLAMEYRFSPWRARGEELSRAAIATARGVGEAALQQGEARAALVYALNARHFAILAPDTLEERMAISLELAQLAQARGDRELTLQSLPWRVADLLTVGHVTAADAAIEQASRLAAEMRQPLYLWYVHVFRALRALMQGQWAEGERLAEGAHTLGQRAQPSGADVYLAAQRFMLHWEQGRLAEMEPIFSELMTRFPAMPVLRCFRALALWHGGQTNTAKAELAQLCANQAATLPWDQLWLGAVATLAELAILLEDRIHAALLYDLLLPYATRNVMVGVPNCLGAVAAYLGALAALLGRRQAAIDHFAAGLAINRQLHIRPFEVRTQVRYAALLLQDGANNQRNQAFDLLTQAQATAQALGMPYLLEQIAPLLRGLRQAQSPELVEGGLTPREIEVLRLIAAGHSTKAMAVALVISVPTVERHITHIYEKLGVSSRAEATAFALRQGLV